MYSVGAHGRVGWVVVACGVALATAAPAMASPTSDWGSKADGPAGEIQNAMSLLYSEMKADDLNGAKAACRRLQASAQSLQSMLPAPNAILTSEVSMGTSALISASKTCLATGPTPNKGEISTVKRGLDTAMAHLRNAQSIIDAG